MKSWRLILSPPSDGAANMAIDEAIFTLHSRPTLRLYSWSRPTLSFGYFQKVDSALLKVCKERGVDAVRRPTGGRAVLHHHEITYSVSAAYEDFPSPHTLMGVYKTVSTWLVDSMNDVGVEASVSEKRRKGTDYTERRNCFLASTPYELTLSGKKVCGSAQKRGRYSFLQHGSILMDMDRGLSRSIFGDDAGGTDAFTTMKDEGYDMDESALVDSMIKKFAETIGCKLEMGSLSGDELKEADRLRAGCRFKLL